MIKLDSHPAGRHFLQIPGPSPVPDRILRAMSYPTIDHRGPEFKELCQEVIHGAQAIFKTAEPVIIYPSSGSGAWEAAIVNTLSPGDKVLMVETGHFAMLWQKMAQRWGIEVDLIAGDWRHGADPKAIEEKLTSDTGHVIKAVMVVHNETSTGVTSRIADIRAAIDRAGHPALLMVDTISSLGSVDYRHDEWGVDVTVSCSQKVHHAPVRKGAQKMNPVLGLHILRESLGGLAQGSIAGNGQTNIGCRGRNTHHQIVIFLRHKTTAGDKQGHVRRKPEAGTSRRLIKRGGFPFDAVIDHT